MPFGIKNTINKYSRKGNDIITGLERTATNAVGRVENQINKYASKIQREVDRVYNQVDHYTNKLKIEQDKLMNFGKTFGYGKLYDNFSTTASQTKEFIKTNDPQLGYMWEVEFMGESVNGVEQEITMYAQSTGIPTYMVEPIKRRFAGVEYSYAGRENSPKVVRVTFWDDQNLLRFLYFSQWIESINQGQDDYMRKITINLLKNTGDKADSNLSIEFDKIFPIEISEVPLTYEGTTMMVFDVVFSFNNRQIK